MPAFRSGMTVLAAMACAALAVLAGPGTAQAYTPEQQQACTPDAMRLCGEFVPNVDAITACMIQKKSQLSPQCRVFFRQGPEPRAGRPTDISPQAKKAKPAKSTKKKKTDEG